MSDMDRVERHAAVHPGVQVALAGPHLDVDADEAAGRELDRRHVAAQHPAVEDHARVGAALVLRDPVGDRVAADLLLAVAGDAEVDRQRARLDEPLRRLEQDEPELALVVGDAAPVRPLAADVELERVGLPELERRRRLDVEVVVDEDGRRVARRRSRRGSRRARARARRTASARRCRRCGGSARRPTRPRASRPPGGPGRRSRSGSRSAPPARRARPHPRGETLRR